MIFFYEPSEYKELYKRLNTCSKLIYRVVKIIYSIKDDPTNIMMDPPVIVVYQCHQLYSALLGQLISRPWSLKNSQDSRFFRIGPQACSNPRVQGW